MANDSNNINKKRKTSDALLSCLPPSDQCQSPLPEPGSSTLPSNLMFYSVEYPFGQFGSPIPAMLPPSFICLSSHWHSMRLEKRSFTQDKQTLAKTKTSVCYQPHSHSESKMQHYNSCWKELLVSLVKLRVLKQQCKKRIFLS